MVSKKGTLVHLPGVLSVLVGSGGAAARDKPLVWVKISGQVLLPQLTTRDLWGLLLIARIPEDQQVSHPWWGNLYQHNFLFSLTWRVIKV